MLQRCTVAVVFWEYQSPKIIIYIIYNYNINIYNFSFDFWLPYFELQRCNAQRRTRPQGANCCKTRNAKKKNFVPIRRPQSHGHTYASEIKRAYLHGDSVVTPSQVRENNPYFFTTLRSALHARGNRSNGGSRWSWSRGQYLG